MSVSKSTYHNMLTVTPTNWNTWTRDGHVLEIVSLTVSCQNTCALGARCGWTKNSESVSTRRTRDSRANCTQGVTDHSHERDREAFKCTKYITRNLKLHGGRRDVHGTRMKPAVFTHGAALSQKPTGVTWTAGSGTPANLRAR